jgi:hypothetical protein
MGDYKSAKEGYEKSLKLFKNNLGEEYFLICLSFGESFRNISGYWRF